MIGRGLGFGWIGLLLCLIGTGPFWAGIRSSAEEATTQPSAMTPVAITILVHDTLQPVSAAAFREAMAKAVAQRPTAIVVDLGTPGGFSESAEEMARTVRRSPVPVLVSVREPGTAVGGEGLRLLLAGNAATMDPDARLVPLEPLRHASRSDQAERQRETEALASALAAAMRRRGRDPRAALALLGQGSALLPDEAKEAGVLDAVTPKDEVALRALWPAGSPAAAAADSAKFIALPMTPRQHLMRALMNPDLTVLLLALGALLILLEINTPGTIVPGAAGLLLVLLSLYALLLMQLRWQGVLLLALSAVMLFAEAQFARGSAFGVAAVVALTLGLRLLVRGPIPELEVDWSTSLGAGLGFGSMAASLVLLGVRARRAKMRTGADAMLGWLAVAQTALQPDGEVLVRGELWRAHLSAGNFFLPAGECVKVQSTDGMTLEVAPMTQHLQEVEAR